MEKAKIGPLATPKPPNQSSPKLAGVIASWMATGMQNFVAIGLGVSAYKIRDFAISMPFDVTILFGGGGSSLRLQPTHLNGFLRKIRQKTSFCVRKCLLGVPMTIFYIWTLKFPKKQPFWGPILTGLGFLQPKTALTWECCKINYP